MLAFKWRWLFGYPSEFYKCHRLRKWSAGLNVCQIGGLIWVPKWLAGCSICTLCTPHWSWAAHTFLESCWRLSTWCEKRSSWTALAPFLHLVAFYACPRTSQHAAFPSHPHRHSHESEKSTFEFSSLKRLPIQAPQNCVLWSSTIAWPHLSLSTISDGESTIVRYQAGALSAVWAC